MSKPATLGPRQRAEAAVLSTHAWLWAQDVKVALDNHDAPLDLADLDSRLHAAEVAIATIRATIARQQAKADREWEQERTEARRSIVRVNDVDDPNGGSKHKATDLRGVRRDVAMHTADGLPSFIFVNGIRVADLATYEQMTREHAARYDISIAE